MAGLLRQNLGENIQVTAAHAIGVAAAARSHLACRAQLVGQRGQILPVGGDRRHRPHGAILAGITYRHRARRTAAAAKTLYGHGAVALHADIHKTTLTAKRSPWQERLGGKHAR
jgi:hypothetical protein